MVLKPEHFHFKIELVEVTLDDLQLFWVWLCVLFYFLCLCLFVFVFYWISSSCNVWLFLEVITLNYVVKLHIFQNLVPVLNHWNIFFA